MKSEEEDQITEGTDTENIIKDNEEEKAAEENQQAKVEEVSNVKVEEKKEEPKENVQKSEKPKETSKADKNQQTKKEQRKPAVQSQKPANKVTTYTSKGLGLLFRITSHVEDGEFMDTIGRINKEQTLNGKKLVVGGPTDYKMIQNDPLEKQYREMLSQRSEVLRTLR